MPEDSKESNKVLPKQQSDFIQRMRTAKRALLYILAVLFLMSLGVIGFSAVKRTNPQDLQTFTEREFKREKERVATESAAQEQKNFAWADFQGEDLKKGYAVYTTHSSSGEGGIAILDFETRRERYVVGGQYTIDGSILSMDKKKIYYPEQMMSTLEIMKEDIGNASSSALLAINLEEERDPYWYLVNLNDKEIFFAYSTRISTPEEERNDPYGERRRHRIYKIDTRSTTEKPLYEVIYDKEIDSFPSTPAPISLRNNMLYLISYGFEGPNRITTFDTKTKKEGDTGIIFDLLELSPNLKYIALETYSSKNNEPLLKPALFNLGTGKLVQIGLEGVSSDCPGGSWGPRGCFTLNWPGDSLHLIVTDTHGTKRVYDTSGSEQNTDVTNRVTQEFDKQSKVQDSIQKLLKSKYGDSVYLQGYKLEK
ncbi:MAG TPA: hypothetical protein VJ179_01365 [Patescibacteria group bacterium]|nr:hypothetical protein [Patescibacteria group bacterium]